MREELNIRTQEDAKSQENREQREEMVKILERVKLADEESDLPNFSFSRGSFQYRETQQDSDDEEEDEDGNGENAEAHSVDTTGDTNNEQMDALDICKLSEETLEKLALCAQEGRELTLNDLSDAERKRFLRAVASGSLSSQVTRQIARRVSTRGPHSRGVLTETPVVYRLRCGSLGGHTQTQRLFI